MWDAKWLLYLIVKAEGLPDELISGRNRALSYVIPCEVMIYSIIVNL